MPFSERKKIGVRSPHRKKIVEADKASLVAQDKAEQAKRDALWNSLSEKQREQYLEKARNSMPVGIKPGKTVLLIVAKDLAGKSALSSHHD